MVMSRWWTLPWVCCLCFASLLVATAARADAQSYLRPDLGPQFQSRLQSDLPPQFGPQHNLDLAQIMDPRNAEMEPLIPLGSAARKYRTSLDGATSAGLLTDSGTAATGGAMPLVEPVRATEQAPAQHSLQSVVWVSMVCLGILILAGFNSRKPRPRYLAAGEFDGRGADHGRNLARPTHPSWDDR